MYIHNASLTPQIICEAWKQTSSFPRNQDLPAECPHSAVAMDEFKVGRGSSLRM